VNPSWFFCLWFPSKIHELRGSIGVFGVLGLEVLRVDFRFLFIEWVLGTELLAKGSPRGTPTIPKVSL
jgi:hypothetical protein